MNKTNEDFSKIWNQDQIPVLFLQEKRGILVIHLPPSSDNMVWLKSSRRNIPKWLEDYSGWQVPKSWLEDITKQSLKKFGMAYVIQLHYPAKKCAPACWNAKGIKCVCSCHGKNHGSGQPLGRWHIVSETCAIQYDEEFYSCKLILPV